MGNPLFDMMNKKSSNIFTGNPQQILMNMLKQQNPQGYNQLQQMMNSGENPQQILKQLTNNMSQQQIQQLRAYASQFGIK